MYFYKTTPLLLKISYQKSAPKCNCPQNIACDWIFNVLDL